MSIFVSDKIHQKSASDALQTPTKGKFLKLTVLVILFEWYYSCHQAGSQSDLPSGDWHNREQERTFDRAVGIHHILEVMQVARTIQLAKFVHIIKYAYFPPNLSYCRRAVVTLKSQRCRRKGNYRNGIGQKSEYQNSVRSPLRSLAMQLVGKVANFIKSPNMSAIGVTVGRTLHV